MTAQETDDGDDTVKNSTSEKKRKKRKRKRKQVEGFEALDKSGISSKRRERKKKYLEAKKNKNKKAKTEDRLDFPGREEIKSGDIVQAPPKLAATPKALNGTQDASKERVWLGYRGIQETQRMDLKARNSSSLSCNRNNGLLVPFTMSSVVFAFFSLA